MNRFRLLLLSLSLVLLAGCEIFPSSDRQEWFPPRFYHVQETNYRGQLIADWIAKGYVRRVEIGYRFRAIERTTNERYPQHVRYPEGRMVTIGSPNIVITSCPEPVWHYERRRSW